MSPISPPALVLVTGAAGFIGTYAVKHLVESGYKVRASVRSEEKGEYLKRLFDIEYIVVPNMVLPGAFAEAVKGVEGVVHVASPLDGTNRGHPQLVIGPAVGGLQSLLDSLKSSSTVKRVVQISSIGAVSAASEGVYDESDWNNVSPALCEKEGAAVDPIHKYGASKVLAERTFWRFFEQPKSFDGVVLNPSLVLGPPLQYSTSNEITGSNSYALMYVRPGAPDPSMLPYGMVDAHDVAVACELALSVPDAGGERYIISASPLRVNDLLLAAQRIPALAKTAAPGNPDKAFRAELEAKNSIFDGRKATAQLGLKYRDKDETIRETLEALAAKL